jgi:hypothetical protein
MKRSPSWRQEGFARRLAKNPERANDFEYDYAEPKSSGAGEGQGVVFMTNKDAFDLWWAWAEKPPHSTLTVPAEIHEAVMALPPNERHDRAKVNEAVREGLRSRRK